MHSQKVSDLVLMNVYTNVLSWSHSFLIFYLDFKYLLLPSFQTQKRHFLKLFIIKEKERNFLRFLWICHVFSDQHKFVCNRFALLVFGVIILLFLLNQNIPKHVKKCEFDVEFCQSIDFVYGDNFAGSADNF